MTNVPPATAEKGWLNHIQLESVECQKLLKVFGDSYLDRNYKHDKWKLASAAQIVNPNLILQFQERKHQMSEASRTPEELAETFCFTVAGKKKDYLMKIVNYGLKAQRTPYNVFGNSAKGLYVSKHCDTMLKYAEDHNETKSLWIIIHKVILGRQLPVNESNNKEPTEGYDCHTSAIDVHVNLRKEKQVMYSQVYIYELDAQKNAVTRPRQCLPIAVVRFDRVKEENPPAPSVQVTEGKVIGPVSSSSTSSAPSTVPLSRVVIQQNGITDTLVLPTQSLCTSGGGLVQPQCTTENQQQTTALQKSHQQHHGQQNTGAMQQRENLQAPVQQRQQLQQQDTVHHLPRLLLPEQICQQLQAYIQLPKGCLQLQEQASEASDILIRRMKEKYDQIVQSRTQLQQLQELKKKLQSPPPEEGSTQQEQLRKTENLLENVQQLLGRALQESYQLINEAQGKKPSQQMVRFQIAQIPPAQQLSTQIVQQRFSPVQPKPQNAQSLLPLNLRRPQHVIQSHLTSSCLQPALASLANPRIQLSQRSLGQGLPSPSMGAVHSGLPKVVSIGSPSIPQTSQNILRTRLPFSVPTVPLAPTSNSTVVPSVMVGSQVARQGHPIMGHILSIPEPSNSSTQSPVVSPAVLGGAASNVGTPMTAAVRTKLTRVHSNQLESANLNTENLEIETEDSSKALVVLKRLISQRLKEQLPVPKNIHVHARKSKCNSSSPGKSVRPVTANPSPSITAASTPALTTPHTPMTTVAPVMGVRPIEIKPIEIKPIEDFDEQIFPEVKKENNSWRVPRNAPPITIDLTGDDCENQTAVLLKESIESVMAEPSQQTENVPEHPAENEQITDAVQGESSSKMVLHEFVRLAPDGSIEVVQEMVEESELENRRAESAVDPLAAPAYDTDENPGSLDVTDVLTAGSTFDSQREIEKEFPNEEPSRDATGKKGDTEEAVEEHEEGDVASSVSTETEKDANIPETNLAIGSIISLSSQKESGPPAIKSEGENCLFATNFYDSEISTTRVRGDIVEISGSYFPSPGAVENLEQASASTQETSGEPRVEDTSVNDNCGTTKCKKKLSVKKTTSKLSVKLGKKSKKQLPLKLKRRQPKPDKMVHGKIRTVNLEEMRRKVVSPTDTYQDPPVDDFHNFDPDVYQEPEPFHYDDEVCSFPPAVPSLGTNSMEAAILDPSLQPVVRLYRDEVSEYFRQKLRCIDADETSSMPSPLKSGTKAESAMSRLEFSRTTLARMLQKPYNKKKITARKSVTKSSIATIPKLSHPSLSNSSSMGTSLSFTTTTLQGALSSLCSGAGEDAAKPASSTNESRDDVSGVEAGEMLPRPKSSQIPSKSRKVTPMKKGKNGKKRNIKSKKYGTQRKTKTQSASKSSPLGAYPVVRRGRSLSKAIAAILNESATDNNTSAESSESSTDKGSTVRNSELDATMTKKQNKKEHIEPFFNPQLVPSFEKEYVEQDLLNQKIPGILDESKSETNQSETPASQPAEGESSKSRETPNLSNLKDDPNNVSEKVDDIAALHRLKTMWESMEGGSNKTVSDAFATLMKALGRKDTLEENETRLSTSNPCAGENNSKVSPETAQSIKHEEDDEENTRAEHSEINVTLDDYDYGEDDEPVEKSLADTSGEVSQSKVSTEAVSQEEEGDEEEELVASLTSVTGLDSLQDERWKIVEQLKRLEDESETGLTHKTDIPVKAKKFKKRRHSIRSLGKIQEDGSSASARNSGHRGKDQMSVEDAAECPSGRPKRVRRISYKYESEESSAEEGETHSDEERVSVNEKGVPSCVAVRKKKCKVKRKHLDMGDFIVADKSDPSETESDAYPSNVNKYEDRKRIRKRGHKRKSHLPQGEGSTQGTEHVNNKGPKRTELYTDSEVVRGLICNKSNRISKTQNLYDGYRSQGESNDPSATNPQEWLDQLKQLNRRFSETSDDQELLQRIRDSGNALSDAVSTNSTTEGDSPVKAKAVSEETRGEPSQEISDAEKLKKPCRKLNWNDYLARKKHKESSENTEPGTGQASDRGATDTLSNKYDTEAHIQKELVSSINTEDLKRILERVKIAETKSKSITSPDRPRRTEGGFMPGDPRATARRHRVAHSPKPAKQAGEPKKETYLLRNLTVAKERKIQWIEKKFQFNAKLRSRPNDPKIIEAIKDIDRAVEKLNLDQEILERLIALNLNGVKGLANEPVPERLLFPDEIKNGVTDRRVPLMLVCSVDKSLFDKLETLKTDYLAVKDEMRRTPVLEMGKSKKLNTNLAYVQEQRHMMLVDICMPKTIPELTRDVSAKLYRYKDVRERFQKDHKQLTPEQEAHIDYRMEALKKHFDLLRTLTREDGSKKEDVKLLASPDRVKMSPPHTASAKSAVEKSHDSLVASPPWLQRRRRSSLGQASDFGLSDSEKMEVESKSDTDMRGERKDSKAQTAALESLLDRNITGHQEAVEIPCPEDNVPQDIPGFAMAESVRAETHEEINRQQRKDLEGKVIVSKSQPSASGSVTLSHVADSTVSNAEEAKSTKLKTCDAVEGIANKHETELSSDCLSNEETESGRISERIKNTSGKSAFPEKMRRKSVAETLEITVEMKDKSASNNQNSNTESTSDAEGKRVVVLRPNTSTVAPNEAKDSMATSDYGAEPRASREKIHKEKSPQTGSKRKSTGKCPQKSGGSNCKAVAKKVNVEKGKINNESKITRSEHKKLLSGEIKTIRKGNILFYNKDGRVCKRPYDPKNRKYGIIKDMSPVKTKKPLTPLKGSEGAKHGTKQTFRIPKKKSSDSAEDAKPRKAISSTALIKCQEESPSPTKIEVPPWISKKTKILNSWNNSSDEYPVESHQGVKDGSLVAQKLIESVKKDIISTPESRDPRINRPDTPSPSDHTPPWQTHEAKEWRKKQNGLQPQEEGKETEDSFASSTQEADVGRPFSATSPRVNPDSLNDVHWIVLSSTESPVKPCITDLREKLSKCAQPSTTDLREKLSKSAQPSTKQEVSSTDTHKSNVEKGALENPIRDQSKSSSVEKECHRYKLHEEKYKQASHKKRDRPYISHERPAGRTDRDSDSRPKESIVSHAPWQWRPRSRSPLSRASSSAHHDRSYRSKSPTSNCKRYHDLMRRSRSRSPSHRYRTHRPRTRRSRSRSPSSGRLESEAPWPRHSRSNITGRISSSIASQGKRSRSGSPVIKKGSEYRNPMRRTRSPDRGNNSPGDTRRKTTREAGWRESPPVQESRNMRDDSDWRGRWPNDHSGPSERRGRWERAADSSAETEHISERQKYFQSQMSNLIRGSNIQHKLQAQYSRQQEAQSKN